MNGGLSALLVGGLLVASPAAAQSADLRDQAFDLAMVESAHDLCGFDLSDAAEDTIGKRRQALIDDGVLSATELASLQDEIAASMKRQVPEGLCKPTGAAATLYRRKVEQLGLP